MKRSFDSPLAMAGEISEAKRDAHVRAQIIESVRNNKPNDLKDILQSHPDVLEEMPEITDDQGLGLLALSVISGGGNKITAMLVSMETDVQTVSLKILCRKLLDYDDYFIIMSVADNIII